MSAKQRLSLGIALPENMQFHILKRFQKGKIYVFENKKKKSDFFSACEYLFEFSRQKSEAFFFNRQ